MSDPMETKETFPYEAVMDLFRLCRDDPKIARSSVSTPYRRMLIQGHVRDVSKHYGVDPKRLSHITALMIENEDVAPAFA